MPDAQFEGWCRDRLAAASHHPEQELETRRVIEQDRSRRAVLREQDKLFAAGLASPVQDLLSESPLEARLLEAFWATAAFEPILASAGPLVGWGRCGALFQQLTVKAGPSWYRLDFAVVVASRDVFLAIEVDGRDYHDRTAQQVQRDRQRDRNLAAAGWIVFRFLGREVYRDADGCAQEVVDAVARRQRANGGRRR